MMKYHHTTGAIKPKSWSKLWLVLPMLGVIIGGYILFNTLSPAIGVLGGPTDATAKKLVAEKPDFSQNRLYVPKVNIDVAVVDIDGNEEIALEKGAIHRAPESGNPVDGGNFVVAAHRFQLGMTPDQTRKKSPFYHIDQITVGDPIYVDYNGTRYAYEVTEKKQVSSGATEIERRGDEDRLTMYSCDLAGPEAGREVVFAKPIGTIAWEDGSPKLKPRT